MLSVTSELTGEAFSNYLQLFVCEEMAGIARQQIFLFADVRELKFLYMSLPGYGIRNHAERAVNCSTFLFQHLLKVQDEYKKREAELEKVKEDKLKIETLLETLKEQVCDFLILSYSSVVNTVLELHGL